MVPIAENYLQWILRENREDFTAQPVKLNYGQMNSLLWSMSHKMSLVQGSAGTGKSYTLAVIASVLKLMNPHYRFCCATVANIAIDKLIEDLLKIRLKYGSPWSSTHSYPDIGERFWGRIGSSEIYGIPTNTRFSSGHFDQFSTSWEPYGDH